MTKGIDITVEIPVFPPRGHPEQEKAALALRQVYGKPHVHLIDREYSKWRQNLRPQDIPQWLYPFCGMFRSRCRGLWRHHFITHFEFCVNTQLTFGTPEYPQEVIQGNADELNALYLSLLSALKNKNFKADENLRIELFQDKSHFGGERLYPERTDYKYNYGYDIIPSEIIKDNNCDFSVYNNYGVWDDSDVPSTGKGRILFYLVNPGALKVLGRFESAQIDIVYEMPKKRKVHPPGQTAENLLKLYHCELSPQESLASVAAYLEHDLMFYDKDGSPAIWWKGFIDRLKHFPPPKDIYDPEYLFVDTWDLNEWGQPPFTSADYDDA